MSDIRNDLAPDINNADNKNAGFSTELPNSAIAPSDERLLPQSSATIAPPARAPIQPDSSQSTSSLTSPTTSPSITEEDAARKRQNSIDLLAEFDPLYDPNNDKDADLTTNGQKKQSGGGDDNAVRTSLESLSLIDSFGTPSNNFSVTNSATESRPQEEQQRQQHQQQPPQPQKCTTPPTAVPTPAANTPLPESDSYGNLAQEYQLKWILWKGGERYPIVTQNANGPCPLLAIINVLLLRKAITIPPMYEIITASQLMDFLCDSILNSVPSNIVDEERANYEQNFQDAMSVLPKLATGLDVNIRFSGVDQFEYTQESIIFDLLNIPLVHGWLSDPAEQEIHRIVGNSSYNQLIDRIISSKGPNGDCNCSEMLLAEEFLNNSASQLTHYGLYRLQQYIKEDELAIFFRNNHFITLYKRNNQLYQLATDQGFLSEPNVVWETLNSIEGNTHFVDSNFVIVPPKESLTDLTPVLDMASQVDQDHLLALSLAREQELSAGQDDCAPQTNVHNIQSDEDFARQLQAEEEKAYEAYRQQQKQLQLQQQQQQQQQQPTNNMKQQQQQQQRPGSAASSSSASQQRLNQPTLLPNQQNHTRAEHPSQPSPPSSQQQQQQHHHQHHQQQSQHRHHHHHPQQHRQHSSSFNQSTSRASLRNSRQSPSPSERSSKSNRCVIS